MKKQLLQLPAPLLQWYREHARVLPWRENPTPYRVLVSEIMLQQTRVAAVLGYFERFMEELPGVRELAEVQEDRLMKLWQGLGYYRRARSLQKAGRMIVGEYGGVFPDTYEALLTLPGVGTYTAGAVASIAFGRPVPAVDGNVMRVYARIAGDETDISLPAMKARVREQLLEIIPVAAPGDFNQALMELGATVCLPVGAPLCGGCPAAALCAAFLTGRTGVLPVKAAKRARRVEERTVYLIFHRGKVALRRRPEKGLLAGLWEYPNEVDDGAEHLFQWGFAPEETAFSGTGKHVFTHIEWHMKAMSVRAAGDFLPEGWIWADGGTLDRDIAVPNAFGAFDHVVRAEMEREGTIWPNCTTAMA